MSQLRERPAHNPIPPRGDGDPETGNDLLRTRDQGNALLAAADNATRRALSGNSERFLQSTRQEGGQ